MACNLCNKVTEKFPQPENLLQYEIFTDTVTSKRGKPLRVKTALIMTPHQPRNGWSVEIVMNGQRHIVSGKTAARVAYDVQQILGLNKIVVSPNNLWANLNVQWLKRTREEAHLLDLENFYKHLTISNVKI